MDILLGRSAGTYQRLERGSAVPAGLLERVGRILALTEDEWRAVHAYAFATPPPRPLNRLDGALPDGWQVMLDSLGPAAYVEDREGIVLAHNEAFSGYFGDEPVPRNLLRWCLTAPSARVILRDWNSAWLPALCMQLRILLAGNANSRTLQELRADVLADSEAAPLLVAAPSTAPGLESPRPLLHPSLGGGQVTLYAARPTDFPEARLMIVHFRSG
ncbi:XRE family transcriptional regulator [Streptomyces sp. NPDC021020]|uniref:MmyB family transcriptional regulator n=1 Tax=Streptomyces sp. NPDC021020 TaxID=3365109 RepID=UPI0037B612A6